MDLKQDDAVTSQNVTNTRLDLSAKRVMMFAIVSLTKKPVPVNNIQYSGGTVCQLSLKTSEFCPKYKLIIPGVSRWFLVCFYVNIQDLVSFLL